MKKMTTVVKSAKKKQFTPVTFVGALAPIGAGVHKNAGRPGGKVYIVGKKR